MHRHRMVRLFVMSSEVETSQSFFKTIVRGPSTSARDDKGEQQYAALAQQPHRRMTRDLLHRANKQLAARRNFVPGRDPAGMRQWN